MIASTNNSFLNYSLNLIKVKNSIFIQEENKTVPALLGKKKKNLPASTESLNKITNINSLMAKSEKEKQARRSKEKPNVTSWFLKEIKVAKKAKNQKNLNAKSPEAADCANEELNTNDLTDFQAQTKEFFKQIKTRNNFITLQKKKTCLVEKKNLNFFFRHSSTEDFNANEEDTSRISSLKNCKLNLSNENKTLQKSLISKQKSEFSRSELTNFSFINLNVFEDLNSPTSSNHTNNLFKFIKEKSLELKQDKEEAPEENTISNFYSMINPYSNANINLASSFNIKNKILNKKLNCEQINFLKNSKINFNKPYLNHCFFNQEKDEVIQDYECVFDDCNLTFKNKNHWEKHYLMHCQIYKIM